MPRSLETRPSLASESAPRATAGLKRSSTPSSGLEPLTERHWTELLAVVLVVEAAPELPELPELPEFDVVPEFPEFPVALELDEQ